MTSQQYPLPSMEECFNKVAEGKKVYKTRRVPSIQQHSDQKRRQNFNYNQYSFGTIVMA